MYHRYYYSFPCGHREYFSPQPCDVTLTLNLAAQHSITNQPSSSLGLGYPAYAYPTCQALQRAMSTAADKQSSDSRTTIGAESESTVRPATVVLGSSHRDGMLPPVVGGRMQESLDRGEADNWVEQQRNLVVAEIDEDIHEEMIRTARVNTAVRESEHRGGSDGPAGSSRGREDVDQHSNQQGNAPASKNDGCSGREPSRSY